MAVYKVIQDIESEDKLLGPLTLKSFIYAIIAGVLAFLCVRLFIASGPIYFRLAVIIVLIFPMLLFGVLASPLGRDQPTEVWLLSRIRFMLKPHGRIWDQAGMDHLVTITAPKKVELSLTKGFSQAEVQSRLQALATTLDSRGWAIKNSTVNLNSQQDYLNDDNDSDRLIAPSSVVQPSQVLDIHESDDIMDEQNNATAQHFDNLVQAAASQRKQKAIDKLNQAREEAQPSASSDTTFLDESTNGGNTTFVGRAVVAPQIDENSDTPTGDEPQLSPAAMAILERERKRADDIHRRSASFKSVAERKAEKKQAKDMAAKKAQEEKARQDAVTAAQAADKLELAQSGNDLSVASIANLANRPSQVKQIGPGEVEISLH